MDWVDKAAWMRRAPLRGATKYVVLYDDGNFRTAGEFPRPERLPMPGDEYSVVQPFYTLASVQYAVGDRFLILDRTAKAPHHRYSSLGNLLIKCKFQTSIWTNFEASVAEGHLELVEKRCLTGP